MLPVINIHLWDYTIRIHSYGLFITLATIVGIIGIYKIWLQLLESKWRAFIYTIFMSVSSLFGARILYVIKNWEKFETDIKRLFLLEFKFFSLFGVMIFGGITLGVLCYISSVSFYRWVDKAIVPLVFSLILSRTGCLMNGCCFGKVTDVWWGIPVRKGSLSYLQLMEREPLTLLLNRELCIHPTQIYEILAILIAYILTLFWYRYMTRKRVMVGLKSVLFAMFFSLGRFIVFWFRDPVKSEDISQIIGGPVLYMFIVSASIFWIYISYYRKML